MGPSKYQDEFHISDKERKRQEEVKSRKERLTKAIGKKQARWK